MFRSGREKVSKPVLLLVESEKEIRQVLQDNLNALCRERYDVTAAASRDEAMATLHDMACRNRQVAVVLADSGELLKDLPAIYPDAKRALLISFKHRDEAALAMGAAEADVYLIEPCQPPEQNLYPPINDLLTAWEIEAFPPFEGLRVVGYRFSPRSHETRDFLVRNCVPFEWLDIERDNDAGRLLSAAGVKTPQLPLVMFPDGTQLIQPTSTDIAQKIGLKVHPENTSYDLVIIGGGPAGLAAAVYAASEGLHTVLIDRHAPGGQAASSSMIENYLGFPAGLTGADLARRAVAQAKEFQVEVITPQAVTGLRVNGSSRIVRLSDGTELQCTVAVLSMGVEWRRLNVPGIERLTGAGVHYGGTVAEALFCRNEDVFIVGGANSAGQAALYFSRYARTVTMLVRAESLQKSMSAYLVDQIEATKNISVRLRTEIVEVHGEQKLEAITIFDAEAQQKEKPRANALFIFIGTIPHTEYLQGVVERDDHGFILTGHDVTSWALERDPFWLESSIPGVFAAGDVRHGSVKRVATSVGEGAAAVQFVHQYLNSTMSA